MILLSPPVSTSNVVLAPNQCSVSPSTSFGRSKNPAPVRAGLPHRWHTRACSCMWRGPFSRRSLGAHIYRHGASPVTGIPRRAMGVRGTRGPIGRRAGALFAPPSTRVQTGASITAVLLGSWPPATPSNQRPTSALACLLRKTMGGPPSMVSLEPGAWLQACPMAPRS